MKSELVSDVASTGRLGGDLAAVLALAAAWSTEVTTRFGGDRGFVLTFVGALGATALTLGAVVVVARSRAISRDDWRAFGIGALLSMGPTALVGAVLRDRTHHRALGGVTFALVVTGLVLFCLLVARCAVASQSSRSRFILRCCLTILVVGSVGKVVRPLLTSFGPLGSLSGRFLAEDLAVGLGVVLILLTRRDFAFPPRVAYVLAFAWALVVTLGVAVLSGNMPLRATLSVRAPVAVGVLGAL